MNEIGSRHLATAQKSWHKEIFNKKKEKQTMFGLSIMICILRWTMESQAIVQTKEEK